MKDSIGDMIDRIKELQDRGENEPGEIQGLRDRIKEKQKKIRELETSQRAIDAKKKKTGPATGFSVGHRESTDSKMYSYIKSLMKDKAYGDDHLSETSPELKRRVADRLENEPSTRKGGMGSGDRASLYRAKADHQDSQRKKEQEKREKIKKARERLSKAEKE